MSGKNESASSTIVEDAEPQVEKVEQFEWEDVHIEGYLLKQVSLTSW